MIDLRTLVQIMGALPVALWREWVAQVAAAAVAPIEIESMSAADIEAAIDGRRRAAIARAQGGIAVVQVRGVIIPRANILEYVGFATSVDTIVSMTRTAMADSGIKAVVHAYDSPGGSSAGVPEGHAELMALRGGDKPIVAVAEHLMASAAYWLASAADEIVAAPSALVGSIGAYVLHLDFSKALAEAGIKPTFIVAGKHKVDANAYEPLSDDAREYWQALVDDAYQRFTADVAKGRGVPVGTVRGESFGQGRVLTSEAAEGAGMIDGVRTLRDTLAAYGMPAKSAPAGGRALALERRRRALALAEL